MLPPTMLSAFSDELEKIAARIPFIHGTSGARSVLKPAVGASILQNDPNARAVYTAMSSRPKRKGIARFAEEAARARGGTPTIASGKMDTKKGWMPFNLTSWGKKNIGDVDDARDLVSELDTATGERRGEIWRTIHKGIGSWRNDDLSATLRVAKNKALRPAQEAAARAA